jgi:hypothetical protein
MSDEPDRQDLEDRVDQLESTISKMLPSRRDALKLGGAALVGGAAMSGSASAGTQQAGTIGTANDPVDVESEDINNADTVTTDTLDTQQASIDQYDLGTSFVSASMSTNQQFVSDNNRVPIEFDNVQTDRRSEYNSSTFQFTPDSDGVYFAILRIRDDRTNPKVGEFSLNILGETLDLVLDVSLDLKVSFIVTNFRFLSAGNTVPAAKMDPPENMTAQGFGNSTLKIARIG